MVYSAPWSNNQIALAATCWFSIWPRWDLEAWRSQQCNIRRSACTRRCKSASWWLSRECMAIIRQQKASCYTNQRDTYQSTSWKSEWTTSSKTYIASTKAGSSQAIKLITTVSWTQQRWWRRDRRRAGLTKNDVNTAIPVVAGFEKRQVSGLGGIFGDLAAPAPSSPSQTIAYNKVTARFIAQWQASARSGCCSNALWFDQDMLEMCLRCDCSFV